MTRTPCESTNQSVAMIPTGFLEQVGSKFDKHAFSSPIKTQDNMGSPSQA